MIIKQTEQVRFIQYCFKLRAKRGDFFLIMNLKAGTQNNFSRSNSKQIAELGTESGFPAMQSCISSNKSQ